MVVETVTLQTSKGIDRSPRIPISRYPFTRTSGEFDYEVHRVTPANRSGLRLKVLPFEELFEYEDPFHIRGKVVHFVQEGKEVVFAKTRGSNARNIGVVTQEARYVDVGGKQRKVLSVGMRAVFPEYQDRNVGTGLAKEGIIRHDPDIVTGQTRIWGIIRMYEKTGLVKGVISPIDGPIPPDVREALRKVLDKSILNQTDLRIGICLGVFPAAVAKRFIPPTTNERAVKIYNKMLELGVNPARGDGIRYGIEVDHEEVQRVKDKGEFIAQLPLITSESESLLSWIPRMATSVWRFRRPR